MENQNISPEEQKNKDLEFEILNLNNERDALLLINAKLGYSTKLMSEFHLTQDDKAEIANALDGAPNAKETKGVYDYYYKKFFNKALGDDSSDFQWSENFSSNIRYYFAVSLGYDPIQKVGDNLSIMASYFSLENKIRTTPDASLRQPMTEKLLKDRPNAVEAMNNAINIVNSFNSES